MQRGLLGARNLNHELQAVLNPKRLVVLLGQRKAVAVAVRGGTMKPRWTKLREWLSRRP